MVLALMNIHGFKDENRWLSNFWPSPFFYNGFTWPAVEHAYVAGKIQDSDYTKLAASLLYMTASEAKSHGRCVPLRPDFDMIKIQLMKELQYEKYHQNPVLMQKLLDTEGCYIEETNHWHDTYWGVCDGVGQNWMGVLVMEIRDNERRRVTNI
jgi:ribA/ribD-fused uncharacterized protein